MRSYKKFACATALCAGIGLAGNAMAANQVVVSVTSDPIQSKTTCGKAGDWSIEFDAGSLLEHGDSITADLPYTSADERATLCRDIDIILARGADYETAGDTGTAWESAADGDLPTTAAASPVYEIVDGAIGSSVSAGGGVFFHVTGTAGSQRVTIDIIGDGGVGTLTVGPDAGDKLIVHFLDQKTYGGADNIYTDTVLAGTYADVATLADNTYCINVSKHSSNLVNVSIDSAKFTFNPSVEVAHTVPPESYSLVNCAKQATGYIPLGELADPQAGADTCNAFDNDDADGSSSGFCAGHTNSNNLLMIQRTDDILDGVNYQIQLEITVNDETGDNGVYWTNDDLVVMVDADTTEMCDEDALTTGSAVTTFANLDGGAPNYAGYTATGTTDTAGDAPAAADCTPTNKIVTLLTDANNLSVNGTDDDTIWVSIPAMNYDPTKVEAGDVVGVKVTLLQAPCGVLLTENFEIGTFDCPAAGSSQSLTFPYFTNMSGDSYWDGIVITNLGSTAGTATITVYEADGDTGTMTAAVGANSQYVNLLSAMVASMTVGGSGDGVLGNATVYITVTTDFSADGFAMIAKAATGESMGYLPRAN